MKPALLLVDDDESIRSQMKWALADDYDVHTAEDRPQAVAAFTAHRTYVVLLDLGLPPHPGDPTEGLATLTELLALDANAKIIVVSGQNEKANALKAIGDGAYDFFAKPVEMDELKLILKRAFHIAELERENRALQQRLSGDGFEGMLGSSPPMLEMFHIIRKVSTTDAPVLILGESGTGKEVAALAIHRRSQRNDGPFIPINCGAIPENLLESELFGHEKGSFTGAHASRKGRVETASGGTLFLDEIGELPLSLQVKMLRFLQEQTIERVGGRGQIKIDTRVIAATNADLKKTMQAGTFREDLYYRLAVVTLKIPPVRDRANDILLLARAFLHRFARENKRNITRFTRDAIHALNQHTWPGNVRELENRVKRAVIMADANQVNAADLELADLSETGTPIRTLKEGREAIERQLIEAALRRHNNKIAPAASELGISRPTFYELMEKLGMRVKGDGVALKIEDRGSRIED
jgi:two-component system, NtrC family, response regulator